MKIKTDFVTDSSSSSFVLCEITPRENREVFDQLFAFMDEMNEKYEQHYIAPPINY